MSESTVMGAARKPTSGTPEDVQGAAPEKRTGQGPFSTPERARRTKLMMLVGASVCIFILMVLVKIGGA